MSVSVFKDELFKAKASAYPFRYRTEMPEGLATPSPEMTSFVEWWQLEGFDDLRVSKISVVPADGKHFGVQQQPYGARGYQGPPSAESHHTFTQEVEQENGRRQSLPPFPSAHLILRFSVECPSSRILERHLKELESGLINEPLPASSTLKVHAQEDRLIRRIGWRIIPEKRHIIHQAFQKAQLDEPHLTFHDFLLAKKNNTQRPQYDERWVEKITLPDESSEEEVPRHFAGQQESVRIKNGKFEIAFRFLAPWLDSQHNRHLLSAFFRDILSYYHCL